jgi:hypothetical protein
LHAPVVSRYMRRLITTANGLGGVAALSSFDAGCGRVPKL